MSRISAETKILDLSKMSAEIWLKDLRPFVNPAPVNPLQVSNLTLTLTSRSSGVHICLMYWSLGWELCFKVTLPFLLNSQCEITIVEVVLLYVYLC